MQALSKEVASVLLGFLLLFSICLFLWLRNRGRKQGTFALFCNRIAYGFDFIADEHVE